MWDQFLIALLLGIIFIFLPGFLFLRSCNQTRFTSLALSPLLAILLFTILGIIYSKIGIASSCLWSRFRNLHFALYCFIPCQKKTNDPLSR